MVPVLAILIWLGVWQVQRLHWKTDLIAQIEHGATLPPVPLEKLLSQSANGAPIGWRNVSVRGHFMDTPPHMLFAVRDGKQALRVLSAFESKSGIKIVTDLGYIPYQKEPTWQRPPVSSDVLLTGVLKPVRGKRLFTPQNRPGGIWYWRDSKTMLGASDADNAVTDYVLDVDTAPGKTGWPIPAPSHADLPNNHLDYALTWFGLALAALAIYFAWHWRAGRLSLRAKVR